MKLQYTEPSALIRELFARDIIAASAEPQNPLSPETPAGDDVAKDPFY